MVVNRNNVNVTTSSTLKRSAVLRWHCFNKSAAFGTKNASFKRVTTHLSGVFEKNELREFQFLKEAIMYYVYNRAIYVDSTDLPKEARSGDDDSVQVFVTVDEAVLSLAAVKKKVPVKIKKKVKGEGKGIVDVTKYYDHPDYDQNSDVVLAYVDGSTVNNGKPESRGGFGVFIPRSYHMLEEVLLSIPLEAHEKVSNNTAELKAMTKALKVLLEKGIQDATIIYDSQYAYKAITGINAARSNLTLVNAGKSALSACKKAGMSVNFKHVYAHTGGKDLDSIGNDIVDRLAKDSYSSVVGNC